MGFATAFDAPLELDLEYRFFRDMYSAPRKTRLTTYLLHRYAHGHLYNKKKAALRAPDAVGRKL